VEVSGVQERVGSEAAARWQLTRIGDEYGAGEGRADERSEGPTAVSGLSLDRNGPRDPPDEDGARRERRLENP